VWTSDATSSQLEQICALHVIPYLGIVSVIMTHEPPREVILFDVCGKSLPAASRKEYKVEVDAKRRRTGDVAPLYRHRFSGNAQENNSLRMKPISRRMESDDPAVTMREDRM
jgi:hypothetical protein